MVIESVFPSVWVICIYTVIYLWCNFVTEWLLCYPLTVMDAPIPLEHRKGEVACERSNSKIYAHETLPIEKLHYWQLMRTATTVIMIIIFVRIQNIYCSKVHWATEFIYTWYYWHFLLFDISSKWGRFMRDSWH